MKHALPVILSLLLLTACQHDIPFAYKMDVQQGNVLEPEKVEQIKVGMTKSQVDHILGMSISRDTFKQDRWDYVYSLEEDHKIVEQRHLTIYFDRNGVVERVVVSLPEAALPPSDPQ